MIHNVYFWLKKDLTPEQKHTFETELAHILEIDYLEHAFIGKPAQTQKRSVTDNTFDYSLMLHFKNMADHDYYQRECPKHMRFVDTCRTLWEKVIVYDSSPIH
jgi:hypothetical protein